LRKIISHHRSYPNADWALPKERVDRLEKLYERLEPDDLVARHSWLFVGMPDLPQGEQENWKAHEETIAAMRLEAVRDIWEARGPTGLMELVDHAASPGEVGMTLGLSELGSEEDDRMLREQLATGNAPRALFARGLAAGRIRKHDREWAEAKFAGSESAWTAEQRGILLNLMPSDGRTWALAERLGPEVDKEYWRLVFPYSIRDANDIERAVTKLLSNRRPSSAIDLVGTAVTAKQPIPTHIIANCLEAALETEPEGEKPLGSFSYHVSKLLDRLEEDDTLGETRLSTLEWAYLPIVGHRDRTPKLLHRELARSPEFFAQVVALVYRAEDAEPREGTEENLARGRCARELLDSWRTLPGATDGGVVDVKTLTEWVQSARTLLKASKRGEIGDQLIGHVLSGSPAGTDGAWPHEAVREVIESAESTHLETGIVIGLYNSRGFFSKNIVEGGVQERAIADRYSGYARAIGVRWPRTRAMLDRIANGYIDQARREDQDAELRTELEM
jgi:hypothetical protein